MKFTQRICMITAAMRALHWAREHFLLGTGWGGHHGGFYGGQSMRIEPDYRRNNELDRLRMRIIEPCMQARGWVSGSNWQAGRQAVRAKNQPRTRNKPQPVESLPWAR